MSVYPQNVRMSLSNSLTGVFNLSLIRRIHQIDDYDRVSARINVLYGTKRFERFSDGDTQFLTIINLIKKPIWQIEILPASLTASPSVVDIFRLYELTSEFKDSKRSLGLVIGGCEDEIIIEFLFLEQYQYFRKIFEMFLSKKKAESMIPKEINIINNENHEFVEEEQEEEIEGEDEGIKKNSSLNQPSSSTNEQYVKNLSDETKTEVFEITHENISQWFKFVYIEVNKKVTSLFLYLKEQKLLKKFRKYLIGAELEDSSSFRILLQVIENYMFDPSTLHVDPSTSFLQPVFENDHIREKIKKNLMIVILDRSFNYYRVLRKRVNQLYGDEVYLNNKHSLPMVEYSKLEEIEDDLIFEKMWMWNQAYLNDNILSLLCFKMDFDSRIKALLRRFHIYETDYLEKLDFDKKVFSSENFTIEKTLRHDPNILINIISHFNRENGVRLEEICFEMYVRVYHREVYFDFRDIYYEILPIEDKYFDAYNSKEEAEEMLIKLRQEKAANRRIIDDFEDFEDSERIDLMMGIYRSIKSKIEDLQSRIKRFDEIIDRTKRELQPYDGKMSKVSTKMMNLRRKFMLSERRFTWIHGYIHNTIETRSFGTERDFQVNLILCLFQGRGGNYRTKPEPTQSYLTLSKYCRLHFFRDVSLAMISSNLKDRVSRTERLRREKDYEEVICVDMFSPLVLTTSLKLIDLVSNVSKRIISINVNSFFSPSKSTKKIFNTKYSFPMDSSYEFVQNLCGVKYLDCCNPYPEVLNFMDNLVRESEKNLHLMKMSRLRRFGIDREFFNKFLVVLGEYFQRRQRLFVRSNLDKVTRVGRSSNALLTRKGVRRAHNEKVMIFQDHKSLDDVFKKIIELDDQFAINHPGVYQLLKGFDNSFWILDQKERDLRLFYSDQGGSFDNDKKSAYRVDHRSCPFITGRTRSREGVDEEDPSKATKSALHDLGAKYSKEVNLALIELLQTQEFYVTNLEIFNDKFLIPMEKQQQQQKHQEEDDEEEEGEGEQRDDDEEEEENIFLDISSELVEELKKIRSVIEIEILFVSSLRSVIFSESEDNLTRLDEIIEKILLHSFALKGYASYMCAYPFICDNFSKEEKTNPKFKSFLGGVESFLRSEKARVYTSRSFLLQPIQRIPRIRMLIERVLKRVGKEFLEHRMLMKAYEKIETMATYSNEKMKEMKNLQKLREDESWLGGMEPLVIPGVRVFKDEVIKVRKIKDLHNTKHKKKLKIVRNTRVLILTHLIVVFYKQKKKKTVVMELEKAVVMKESIKDDEVAKFGLVVKSHNNNIGFSFCFDEVSNRDEWGKVISEIIGKSKMVL